MQLRHLTQTQGNEPMRTVSILSDKMLIRVEITDGINCKVASWSIDSYNGQSADDSNRVMSLEGFNLDWEGFTRFIRTCEGVLCTEILDAVVDCLGIGTQEVYRTEESADTF